MIMLLPRIRLKWKQWPITTPLCKSWSRATRAPYKEVHCLRSRACNLSSSPPYRKLSSPMTLKMMTFSIAQTKSRKLSQRNNLHLSLKRTFSWLWATKSTMKVTLSTKTRQICCLNWTFSQLKSYTGRRPLETCLDSSKSKRYQTRQNWQPNNNTSSWLHN